MIRRAFYILFFLIGCSMLSGTGKIKQQKDTCCEMTMCYLSNIWKSENFIKGDIKLRVGVEIATPSTLEFSAA